jgi:hypothetical protein
LWEAALPTRAQHSLGSLLCCFTVLMTLSYLGQHLSHPFRERCYPLVIQLKSFSQSAFLHGSPSANWFVFADIKVYSSCHRGV